VLEAANFMDRPITTSEIVDFNRPDTVLINRDKKKTALVIQQFL
jgi:hypothetical protein